MGQKCTTISKNNWHIEIEYDYASHNFNYELDQILQLRTYHSYRGIFVLVNNILSYFWEYCAKFIFLSISMLKLFDLNEWSNGPCSFYILIAKNPSYYYKNILLPYSFMKVERCLDKVKQTRCVDSRFINGVADKSVIKKQLIRSL